MLGSTMASRRDVEDLLTYVRRHRIVPRVDSTFALADVAAAHRHLESAAQVGKVVLRVGSGGA
jgi:D-arabinose 1-dehydrogenase-like Zn-dependent alcohol dehydrogenase